MKVNKYRSIPIWLQVYFGRKASTWMNTIQCEVLISLLEVKSFLSHNRDISRNDNDRSMSNF